MKKTIAFLLMMSMLLAMVACSKPAAEAPAQTPAVEENVEEAEEPAEKWKVGITFCTSTAASVKYAWEQAEKYAAERGDIELICYDGEGDAAKQADQIQNLISQDCDVIVLNPISGDGFGSVAKDVVDAGIIFMVWCQGIVDGSEYQEAWVGADDVQMGRMFADKMAELKGEDATLVLNMGPIGSTSVVDRINGIEAQIEEKYPNMTILEQRFTEWDQATARTNMEDFITAYGDEIDGVICMDDTIAVGTIDALKAAGYEAGEVAVLGYCGTKNGMEYLENGYLAATMYQPLAEGVCKAVDVGIKAAAGEEVEEVYWDELPWITKDNMSEFPFAY